MFFNRFLYKKAWEESRNFQKPFPEELKQIINNIENHTDLGDGFYLPSNWESYLRIGYFKNWKQTIRSFKNFEEIELYEKALGELKFFIPLMIKDPKHFKKEYLERFEKELANCEINISGDIFSEEGSEVRCKTDLISAKITKIRHYSKTSGILGIIPDWENYLTLDYFKNWCDKIVGINFDFQDYINSWNQGSELNLFDSKLNELVVFIGWKVKNKYDKKTANLSIREKEEELAKIKTEEEMDSRRLLFLSWNRFCPTCNKDVLFRKSSLKEQREKDYQPRAWCNDCGTDIGSNQSMKICLKCLEENNWNNENNSCHRVYVKGDWGERHLNCPIHGKNKENIRNLTKTVNELENRIANGEILSSNQQEELAKARKRILELQKSQVNNQQKPANWIPWITGSSVLLLFFTLVISFLAIRKIKKKQKRN